MTSIDNAARWLEDVKFQLSRDPCKDDVAKTLAFTLTLQGPLREAFEEIEEENPGILWRELIDKLRQSYLPTADRFTAYQDTQYMKFRYDEKFGVWLRKWEDAFTLTYGTRPDPLMKISFLMRALPFEDQLAVSSAGQDTSYAAVVKFMTNRDGLKRYHKQRVESRPTTNHRRESQPQRNQESYQRPQPPKPLARPTYHSSLQGNASSSRPSYEPRPTYQPPANKGCYNCHQPGHISAQCPQAKVRAVDEQEKQPEPTTSSVKRRRPRRRRPLPEVEILQGDDPTPVEAHDQVRMVSEDGDAPNQCIGEVSPPHPMKKKRKGFQLRAEVRGPDDKVTSQREVVLDTGADISLIHSDLVEELPVTIYPCDSDVSGVNSGALDLLGFCYLSINPQGGKRPQLLKFYVIRAFSSSLLLGENFFNAFKVNLDSDHGKKKITFGTGAQVIRNPILIVKALQLDALASLIKRLEKQSGEEHPKPWAAFPGNKGRPQIYGRNNQRVCLIDVSAEVFENWSQADQLRHIINPYLTNQQKEEAFALIWDFRDIFSQGDHDLGLVPHTKTGIEIELDGNVPFQGSYNVSPEKKIKFEETVKPLMAADILEESTDPGGVPALLVDKPNGSYRLVVDYRKLNAKCRKIEYPMPNIDTCLESLKGCQYYYIGDLAQGYHQLELAPKERKKTVFVTPDRKLRYTRLPMGYVNAPYHFQKLVNEILDGLQYKNCIGYFDDLIACGKTWGEFIANTRLLFERIRKYGLKFKTAKCMFGCPEVKFLGHIVNKDGIKPNPAKVDALKSMNYPDSKKALRSMLGLFTFFSRYIEKYSILAQPLFGLTSKSAAFKLTDEHKRAIDQLKDALVKDCLLNHFRAGLPTKLSCDASDKAIGGVLMQEETITHEGSSVETKSWRPVSYYSQVLLDHQRNYTVSEKELLGILIGITKFRHYLEGQEFIVETDHHALCQLPNLKFKNGRINRWSLLLQGFRYKVAYRCGKDHLSDCLSRHCYWDHRKPFIEESELEDRVLSIDIMDDALTLDSSEIELAKLSRVGEALTANMNEHQTEEVYETYEVLMSNEPELLQELSISQHNDKFYAGLIQDLSQTRDERVNDPELLKQYSLKRGLLYRNPEYNYGKRLVLTKQMFDELFRYEHYAPEGGHFGPRKTFERLKLHYWMPKLFEEIHKSCAKCNLCAMYKATTRVFSEAQLKGIDPLPFGTLELDVQGPFKRSKIGNKVVIVMTDSLTRFTFAKAARHQETPQIINFLTEVFNTFGYPRIIRTDQGTNFMSDLFADFLNERHIKHFISNAYHPQGQGQVERMNRTIGDRIKMYADGNHRSWDDELPAIVFGINNAIHSVTKYPPAFLLFGFTPRKLSDLRFEVKPCTGDVLLARSQAYDRLVEAQKRTRDRLVSISTSSNYQPGDLVVIKRKAPDLARGKKLTKPYYGPFLVLMHERGHIKTISLLPEQFGHRNAYNVDVTKPFHGTLSIEQKKKLREFCSEHNITPELYEENHGDETSCMRSTLKNDEKNDDNNNKQPVENSPENIVINEAVNIDPATASPADQPTTTQRELTVEPSSSKQTPSAVSGDVGLDPCMDSSAIEDSIKRHTRLKAIYSRESMLSNSYNLRSKGPIVKMIDSIWSVDSTTSTSESLNSLLASNKPVKWTLQSSDISKSFELINILSFWPVILIFTLNCDFHWPLSQQEKIGFYRLKARVKINIFNCKTSSNRQQCSFLKENVPKEKKKPKLTLKSLSSHLPPSHFLLCSHCDYFNYFVSTSIDLIQTLSRVSTSIMSSTHPKIAGMTAKEVINRLIEGEIREKDACKRIIIEKISKTMISDDIVRKFLIDFPQPPHGYPRWHLHHDKLDTFIDRFLCHLCGQFARLPVQCSQCEWRYCKQCVEYLRDLHPKLCYGDPLPSKLHFMCFSPTCVNGESPRYTSLASDELELYNSVHFRCRHVLCYLLAPPRITFPHEDTCKCGPFDWSLDPSLLLNHYGGEYYDQYIKLHPVNWRDMAIPASKRTKFFAYQRDSVRKESLRVWLLDQYPKMGRPELSALLECGNGWADGIRQAKYADGYLSAGEQICQLEWKLPPYQATPEMARINIKPLDPKQHPQYDPVSRKLILPSLEPIKINRVPFRPSKEDLKVLDDIAEKYSPQALAREKAEEEAKEAEIRKIQEPSLVRYLGKGKALKPKVPVAPCKEKMDTSTPYDGPSTSSGITKPRYQATEVKIKPSIAPIRPPSPVSPTPSHASNSEYWTQATGEPKYKRETPLHRASLRLARERSLVGGSIRPRTTIERVSDPQPYPPNFGRNHVPSMVVVPSQPENSSSRSFQRPQALPQKKSISWGTTNYKQLPPPPSSNSSSSGGSSVFSGDGHGEKYSDPEEKRPFIRKPFWVEFDEDRRSKMDELLKKLPLHLGNQAPTIQTCKPEVSEEKRANKIRARNRRAVAGFESRPSPKWIEVAADYLRVIKYHQEKAPKDKVILSIGMITETETDKITGKNTDRPLWIVLMDQHFNVVYESLCKNSCTFLHTKNHGIDRKMIREARPHHQINSQVIEYIAASDILVGAGLINLLHALGLCNDSIKLLQPKLRDMTVHYSPRQNQGTKLAVNALLLFKERLIEPDKPHPHEMAKCAMMMYLFEMPIIEFRATSFKGIHYANQKVLSGHPRTTQELNANYREFDHWPIEWQNLKYPYLVKFPTPCEFDGQDQVYPVDPMDQEDVEDDGSMFYYPPEDGIESSSTPNEPSQKTQEKPQESQEQEVTSEETPMEDEPTLAVILDQNSNEEENLID